jgi:transcriptional regulator with XRE-family HTH domain
MSFGQRIKELRIERKLTLRECCAKLGVDPSNWSKMERSVTPAPKDSAIVQTWGRFLGLDGHQLDELCDLAALSRSEIPASVASDERVLAALPAFFRAARGNDLDGEKLKAFIEDIRSIHSPDRTLK